MTGAPLPRTSEANLSTADLAALNKRCSNRRLRDELQVALRYPKIQIGLPNALTTRDFSPPSQGKGAI
jgi:hypothetical protein